MSRHPQSKDESTSDRDRWDRHANIGGPAGMMLEIHDSFRGASTSLRDESAGTSPNWELVGSVFRQLSRVLDHHHHAEEALLFPRLTQAGVSADDLAEEHQQLVASIAAVQSALASGDGAGAALVEFDELLTAHLDAEEAVAIPYLLDNPWL